MFEISGLSISYGSVEVVHGVSMRVDKGQIVALIGPNGAGKSSVLKAVSGLIRPTAGEILFLGASLIGVPPHEIAAAGVAHVMEGRRLFGGLTVEDNLLLAGSDDEKASAGNIEAVYQRWPRLRERRNQLAGTLSGGEQQMLAIGRALMTRPRLLMLDEPSWGLAPLIVRDLMHAFSGLRDQGMTILLVEQMANLALQICDYAYVMTTGRVVLEGTSEDLLSNPDLQATYLGGETGKAPGPPARLEQGEAPRAEPSRARERAPKESPRQPQTVVGQVSDPLAPLSVPRRTANMDLPGTGALAEQERLRQLREQAFRSDRSSVEPRREVVSREQDLSTPTVDRAETHGSSTAAPHADDMGTRERIRLEKQAAHAASPGEHAVTKRSGTAFSSREAARRTRQAEFGRKGSIKGGGEQPLWATQEERRRQRQKEMEESGVSGDAGSSRPAASRQRDRRVLEHERRERERSFVSGTGMRLDRVGPELADYGAREKARRERAAAKRQSGKAPEPES